MAAPPPPPGAGPPPPPPGAGAPPPPGLGNGHYRMPPGHGMGGSAAPLQPQQTALSGLAGKPMAPPTTMMAGAARPPPPPNAAAGMTGAISSNGNHAMGAAMPPPPPARGMAGGPLLGPGAASGAPPPMPPMPAAPMASQPPPPRMPSAPSSSPMPPPPMAGPPGAMMPTMPGPPPGGVPGAFRPGGMPPPPPTSAAGGTAGFPPPPTATAQQLQPPPPPPQQQYQQPPNAPPPPLPQMPQPPANNAFRPAPPSAVPPPAPAPKQQQPMARKQNTSGSNRIDPSQIPRPKASPLDAKATVYMTRVTPSGNVQHPYPTVANVPPPASRSSFVVQDTGNCSPRFMRASVNNVPCTSELLGTSGLPLSIAVSPLAVDAATITLPVVDLSSDATAVPTPGAAASSQPPPGPVRCARCKAYINPFFRFVDDGKRMKCNMCGHTQEVPPHYFSPAYGTDGRRADHDTRPELQFGTVEYVVSPQSEYSVRPAMLPVYAFVIDASRNAKMSGAFHAAIEAVIGCVTSLAGGDRARVIVATYDRHVHFYRVSPDLEGHQLLVVPDIDEPYAPTSGLSELACDVSKCSEKLVEVLQGLLEAASSAQPTAAAGMASAGGAAVESTIAAMKGNGGKLLWFCASMPDVGIGKVTSAPGAGPGAPSMSADHKDAMKIMQSSVKHYADSAKIAAEHQICVHLLTLAGPVAGAAAGAAGAGSSLPIGLVNLAPLATNTGGDVRHYPAFRYEVDREQVLSDVRWIVSRPQGLEALMRVRCSAGLSVIDYSGSYCRRTPVDVDLPCVDCDKNIFVRLRYDDTLQESEECCVQAAALYTSPDGTRRIRVHTLSLPCTSVLGNVFRGADLEINVKHRLVETCQMLPVKPPAQIKEHITSRCVDTLYAYRKFCATNSSSGQLILPEALKLLPLYTLALNKAMGLRMEPEIDERVAWMHDCLSLNVDSSMDTVYGQLMRVDDVLLESDSAAADGAVPDVPRKPSPLSLSSEGIDATGIYLFANGRDLLCYVGKRADPSLVHDLFGTDDPDTLCGNGPRLWTLMEFDSVHSKQFTSIVLHTRTERCKHMRLRLLRHGSREETLRFFDSLIEDRSTAGMSYVEYLCHVHRQIQNKFV